MKTSFFQGQDWEKKGKVLTWQVISGSCCKVLHTKKQAIVSKGSPTTLVPQAGMLFLHTPKRCLVEFRPSWKSSIESDAMRVYWSSKHTNTHGGLMLSLMERSTPLSTVCPLRASVHGAWRHVQTNSNQCDHCCSVWITINNPFM